ncbi:MAG: hypothetical protein GEU87_02340 [Alphaproteobacteria bacterium]|nr:hypothetical protein [Alphaproteobacteria bacterium]
MSANRLDILGDATVKPQGFRGSAFGGRFAWRRADLDDDRCYAPLTGEAETELDRVAEVVAGRPLDAEMPRAQEFELEATAKLMADIGNRIFHGIGFAMLDRLPVERWGVPASRSVAWLLTSLLGPIVEQKFDGTRIYDVRDKGKKLTHGVRRSITNLEQEFHTDGGWLPGTPEIAVLACLRQAKQGGMSRVSSLATVHDQLLDKAPVLLAQLYKPLWWDRQAEHAQGEPPCSQRAIFTSDGGGIDARYYDDYVRQGHRLMDSPLDETTLAALDALKAEIEAPEHCFDFFLEPGQIEFVNNRLIAHARTRFEDTTGSDQGRHLIRLWVRRTGGTALESTA